MVICAAIIDLGLESAAEIERVAVHWPSDEHQIFRDMPVNQRSLLIQPQNWLCSCW